jgi:hypothetical protein
MKVYFVTAVLDFSLCKLDPAPKWESTKRFGFFTDLAEAKAMIQAHGPSLVESRWDYLVIEEYEEGFEQIPEEIQWYKLSDNQRNWVPTEKPEWAVGTVCFAIP